MEDVIAIVLAAGKGTRMKSDMSKLVHKIYGKELVKRVVELSKAVGITKTLKDVGCTEEDLEMLAKKAMEDPCKPGNPRDARVEDLIELYRQAM